MRPRIGRALDEASALSDAALAERWLTQLAAPPRRDACGRGCAELPALIRALDRHQLDTKKEVA